VKIEIVPLDNKHIRSTFFCGKESLDHYIQKQVRQDIRKKLTTCFVLPDEQNSVAGYYTLSNAGISLELVPDAIRKKMPGAYSQLPVILLGRLAVDQQYRNQGLGKILLVDALKRSLQVAVESIGSMAVVVDPLDDQACSFYRKFGFIILPDSNKMFLPMVTIANAF
jgi:ribosomal protein S18 acetylase RimI-like enzyme